jgi:hypothetical protein
LLIEVKRFLGKEKDFLAQAAGLCCECRHHRRILSDRGSAFYLCERAASDPRFPRYPALPVLQCGGFETGTAVPEDCGKE